MSAEPRGRPGSDSPLAQLPLPPGAPSLQPHRPLAHPTPPRPSHSFAQALLSLPFPGQMLLPLGILPTHARLCLWNPTPLSGQLCHFTSLPWNSLRSLSRTQTMPCPSVHPQVPLAPAPSPEGTSTSCPSQAQFPHFHCLPWGHGRRGASPTRARFFHCPAASTASPTCCGSWDNLQEPIRTSGQRLRSS